MPTSQTKRVRSDSRTVLATAPMLSVTNMPVTLYISSENPGEIQSGFVFASLGGFAVQMQGF